MALLLTVFIAFMMRYHPAILKIKKWLGENVIGSPICARLTCGASLKLWHPWEDYSESYAANKRMGGGPINTLCHEVDLLSFLFGHPNSTIAFTSRKSSLKITTEHAVEIILNYKHQIVAEVHLDYLQNPPKRYWEIVGDKGRIEYDYYNNLLILYTNNKKGLGYKKKIYNFSGKFERNDMFVNELKIFLECVKKKKISEIPLETGINNLETLVAIHRSIKNGRVVNIKKARS